MPDPQDPQTFLRSKLDWSQPSGEPHAELLAWYRELIALRRARPELTDPWLDRIEVSYDEEARWLVAARGGLLIVASLAEVPLEIPLPEAARRRCWPPPARACGWATPRSPCRPPRSPSWRADPAGRRARVD